MGATAAPMDCKVALWHCACAANSGKIRRIASELNPITLYSKSFSRALEAFRVYAFALAAVMLLPHGSEAQEKPADEPPKAFDVIHFINGEKLTGKLISADGSAVKFKSEMAGEITVEWSKIQELQTAEHFAVLPKSLKNPDREDVRGLPQGEIAVAEQTLTVAPQPGATPQSMPVGEVAHVLDESSYRNALSKRNIFRGWRGGITAALALVQATQNNRTVTSNVNLIRTDPTESWLAAHDRMAINFSSAYGLLKQTGQSTVKTNIIHGDIERDRYFTTRLFSFGQASFDHNFSQGLDLQQNYSGGIGWTIAKSDQQQLDVKASIGYLNQRFQESEANPEVETQHLIGSIFSQSFLRKFHNGISIAEQLSITPAWNNLNAYGAMGSTTVTFPVHKQLQATFGVVDNFLNNPPPGFRKNSFQLTTGLTYLFQ